jgi:hypothetical protein
MDRRPNLDRETIAARDILDAVRASREVGPEDEPLVIASETNLMEAMQLIVAEVLWLESAQEQLKAFVAEQNKRLARFADKEERLRSKLGRVFEDGILPSPQRLPSGTVSYGKGRRKVHVTSLLAVPKQFLRFPEPQADKRAIELEWRDGRPVAGTELGNPEPVLTIRRS